MQYRTLQFAFKDMEEKLHKAEETLILERYNIWAEFFSGLLVIQEIEKEMLLAIEVYRTQ